MVKKFVKVESVEISHEDQEVKGLKFRVQFKHNGKTVMLITGAKAAVDKYVVDHQCIELVRDEIKSLYDDTFSSKEELCSFCGGTGIKRIPEYNVSNEEAKLTE